jgi:hypothetical protein
MVGLRGVPLARVHHVPAQEAARTERFGQYLGGAGGYVGRSVSGPPISNLSLLIQIVVEQEGNHNPENDA